MRLALAKASIQRARWHPFGTLPEVMVADPDRAKVEQALAQLSPNLGTMSREWNAWKPGSLGSVNAAAALGVTQAMVVDADRRVQLTGSMAERVSLSRIPRRP